MCQQDFIATQEQSEFIVTEFELTQEYLLSINGILTRNGHYRNGNTVIFEIGLSEGDEVVIIN